MSKEFIVEDGYEGCVFVGWAAGQFAGISPNTMTKMRRGEEVSMTVLNKICATLGVSYGDIMEYIPLEAVADAIVSDK